MSDVERITVRVLADGRSEEALFDLTDRLRQELLAADLPDVVRARVGTAPAHAKAGEALAVAALTIALGQAMAPLAVDVISSWLKRQPVDVTVEIGTIKVSGTLTREQRDALIEAARSQIVDGRHHDDTGR